MRVLKKLRTSLALQKIANSVTYAAYCDAFEPYFLKVVGLRLAYSNLPDWSFASFSPLKSCFIFAKYHYALFVVRRNLDSSCNIQCCIESVKL